MAGDMSRYSRVVSALRVVLPLAALGLLATLFLFSRVPTVGTGGLSFTASDSEALLREPRMTAPRYAGMTADGAEIALSADNARSDPQATGAEAARPVLTLATPDGVTYRVNAAEARLDQSVKVVVLSGGAELNASSGYAVRSDSFVAALDQTFAESGGAVTATGPQGDIAAGRMRLDLIDGAYVLVFKSGVKLIYRPGS